MDIFIGNLSARIGEYQLKELFEAYGKVLSVKIIKNFCGVSKGYGLLEMPNEKEAIIAVNKLNGVKIDGTSIHAEIARKKK